MILRGMAAGRVMEMDGGSSQEAGMQPTSG